MKWLLWRAGKVSDAEVLTRILELWLRKLRDVNGVDFARHFSLQPERGIIRFNHPSMSPAERGSLAKCINLCVDEVSGCSVEVASDSKRSSLERGCVFALQFKKLHRWRPPPLNEEPWLEQKLYIYGQAFAKALYQNHMHPADEDPFVWSVVPVTELRSVWVNITPNIDDYPSLLPPYAGWLEQDIAIIQEELPRPDFRAARFVQNENVVKILFDYLGGITE